MGFHKNLKRCDLIRSSNCTKAFKFDHLAHGPLKKITRRNIRKSLTHKMQSGCAEAGMKAIGTLLGVPNDSNKMLQFDLANPSYRFYCAANFLHHPPRFPSLCLGPLYSRYTKLTVQASSVIVLGRGRARWWSISSRPS
jgi:hypothetical protein